MKVTSEKNLKNPSFVVENNYYYGLPVCYPKPHILHQRSRSFGFEHGMFYLKVK